MLTQAEINKLGVKDGLGIFNNDEDESEGVLWFDVNPSSFARSVEKMVLNKTSFQVENLKYLNPQTEYLEGYNEALNDLLKILDAKQ